MPVITAGALKVDYTDDGAGPAVVLVHSSVSGNRQWRALIDDLKPDHRVLAVNLFGYGETPPWPGGTQTLETQAELVLAVCNQVPGPVRLVGHSFGGSVALKTAQTLGERVTRMVLLEPNPFYLLQQDGRDEAYREALGLRDFVKEHGRAGDWERVAARFADYWVGDGALAAMPDKRRNTFITSMPPNFYEWDGLDLETATAEDWHRLPAQVLVVRARDTKRSVGELFDLLRAHCTRWSFAEVPSGGHMAPLSRPDLINPIVRQFLDTGHVT